MGMRSTPARRGRCLPNWPVSCGSVPGKALPLVLLPCELFENNASKLLELVIRQARLWSLPEAFEVWLRRRCSWINNLVDCIITSPPADHPLAERDPLLVCAEPYALWALERQRTGQPDLFQHPAMQIVDDLTPYLSARCASSMVCTRPW